MEKRVYIHELKEWPNFTYSNDKILPLLSQVRLKQGMLLGRMKDIGFEIQSFVEKKGVSIEFEFRFSKV